MAAAAAAAHDGRAHRRKRPNRPASERREQYARARARVSQTLVKDLLALNHRGCRRSKFGDALLRLLSEESHGDNEDFNFDASAGPPWQWQWPQAAEFWMQPSWQWQVHQPQSPLEPAEAARRAAHGTAFAEEEASATLVTTGPHQSPASLVLEQSPVRSDGSFTSTTDVPNHKFGRRDSPHSQALDTEEAEVKEAAPAPPAAGQANLSVKTVPRVLPQPAQKPSASNLGETGESSQASLEPVAPAATPTALDDKVSTALANARDTTERLRGHADKVALFQRLSLDGSYLKDQQEMVEVLTRQRESELHKLVGLQVEQARARRKAGATKQQNAG